MSFSEWKEVSLEEISDMKYGKMPKKEDIIEKGYPIYSGYRVTGYHKDYMFDEPQLIVVARGVGGTGDVKLSPPKCYLTNLSIAVMLNEKLVSKKYLYYYFQKQNLRNLDTGSAQSQITIADLKRYKIAIPQIFEQKAIADTLSCLDDKIELNNNINKTLEEMAQAIFKSWFVDFEPFQDGEFEDSELGRIPKGWKVNALYDFAGYINGASFKKDEYATSGCPIIKITELKNGITNSTQYFSGTKDEKYYIKTGDILFSWSGNPETSIDTFIWVGGDAILNQHTFKISIKNNDYSFIYLLLKFFKPAFTRIASSKQTTGLGHVTISDLKRIKFPYDHKAVEEFCIILNPVIEMYVKNLLENEKLNDIRDTLLPKLISGEIRVPIEEV